MLKDGNKTKTCIQSIVLKKTFETIVFDYRRNYMLKGNLREVNANAIDEMGKEVVLQKRRRVV